MKVIQLQQPLRLEQFDLKDPSSLQPGETLVRTARTGICGTHSST